MKILITGATGLIGRSFINEFTDHQYTALCRNKHAASSVLGKQVNLISSLEELTDLNDFDAVINLAGEPIVGKRWNPQQKQKIVDSRCKTTQTLVELFLKSSEPPKAFISGSAIGIYGVNCQQGTDERSLVVAQDFAAELCLRWENIAHQAAERTRVATLRTGIVLSAKGGALQKMLPAFRLNAGGRLGDGSQFMSWIHISDMISAIHFILENETIEGPVNLVSPQPVTNQTFTQALAKSLNKIAVLPAPSFALKLALGEAASLLLGSQHVKPTVLEKAGYRFQFPELTEALNDSVKD